MLKKKFKLPVQNFPKKTKAVLNGSFVTTKATDNNLGYNRIGVIIQKGIVKSAVKRNSIKRFIFNFFNTNIDIYSDNKDILVIFKSKKTNYKEGLSKELEKTIDELNKQNDIRTI